MDLRPSINFWVIEWKTISLNKRRVVSRNQFSHALYLSVSSSLCEWPVATELKAPIPISICVCICICICICWSTSAPWTKRWADGGDTNEARAHLFSRGENLRHSCWVCAPNLAQACPAAKRGKNARSQTSCNCFLNNLTEFLSQYCNYPYSIQ